MLQSACCGLFLWWWLKIVQRGREFLLGAQLHCSPQKTIQNLMTNMATSHIYKASVRTHFRNTCAQLIICVLNIYQQCHALVTTYILQYSDISIASLTIISIEYREKKMRQKYIHKLWKLKYSMNRLKRAMMKSLIFQKSYVEVGWISVGLTLLETRVLLW